MMQLFRTPIFTSDQSRTTTPNATAITVAITGSIHIAAAMSMGVEDRMPSMAISAPNTVHMRKSNVTLEPFLTPSTTYNENIDSLSRSGCTTTHVVARAPT